MRLVTALLVLAILHCTSGQAAESSSIAKPTSALRPRLDLELGHGGSIRAIAASPDGKIVASGSDDNTVKLWSTATGELLHTLEGHNAALRFVSFLPDKKTVVSGSGDGVVKQWNVRTGAEVRTISRLNANEEEKDRNGNDMAISANGRMVASAHGHTIKVWSMPDKILKGTFKTEDFKWLWVYKVVLSSDGGMVAVASEADKSGAVGIWDVQSGKPLRMLTAPGTGIYGCAFSPDGRTFASGMLNNTLNLWDVQTGGLRRAMTAPRPPETREGNIWSVAFSPDGQTIASGHQVGGAEINLWDARTGQLKQTWFGEDIAIYALGFSANGKVLTGGGLEHTVKVWDAQTGDLRLKLGRVEILTSALSPDGNFIAGASGGDDEVHEIRLWNTRTGEQRQVLEGHRSSVWCLAWMPDGKTLVSGGTDGLVKLWDVPTGRLLRTLEGQGWIRDVDVSPDGTTVASASSDTKIKLWDVQTGQLLHTLTGHTKGVASCDFSPDGKVIASAGGDDKTINVWDVATGKLLRTFPLNVFAASVKFSPDGSTLAGSGGEYGNWQAPGIVQLWNTTTWTLQKTFANPMSMTPERSVTFAPDGKTIASASDAAINLWDVASGERLRTLREHTSWVERLDFSPDGKRLFSSSADSTVRAWKMEDGRLLVTLRPLPPRNSAKALTVDARALTVESRALTVDAKPLTADAKSPDKTETTFDYIAVTPEGYYSGSAQADRYIRFKLGNDKFPAEAFQSRYYRPDLVRRALAGQELPLPSDLKGPVPPVLTFVPGQSLDTTTGNTTVIVDTTDDSGVKTIVFFVNGARVEVKITPAEPRPLTADSRGLTVDAKGLTVDAKALTVDAKPLPVESRDIPAAHKIMRRFTASVPLPRDGSTIRLQAIAFDDDGLQSPREEILFSRDKTVHAAPTAGRLLGLCVGVSHYRDAKLNLKYADADAKALSGVLNQQRGIYRVAQVTALINEQATREGVKAGLDKLVAQTTRADTAIVLLSGHGWRSNEGTFYFATHEVDRKNVASTALPWRDVVERLTKLSEKSKRVIVFLDACHSGSAATNEELVKAVLSANAGVLILASSRGSEVSLEAAEWGHGAFTKALLEGIAGKAAPDDEKNVMTLDFLSYVSRRVKALTENQQHPQVPFLQDFDTDAAILAKS